MSTYAGRWHGLNRYFGLHYDLHAGHGDTELGVRAKPAELARMFKLASVDFVQTDCKGHPGYTSWFSKTRGASVPPKLKADALKGWREGTRRVKLPLHCHYSGIWDMAAGAKHPDWTRVGSDGKRAAKPEKMCPRGPYLEKLLIPQMLELIDRYKVDGFWVDGDIWATEPCYCKRCCAEFTRRTGTKRPPKKQGDANWPAWIQFSLDSFYEYVTRYCDAVHRHKPGVLVASNWIQTFRNPGKPAVPTDWISGDNNWVWGLDGSRCEARFISTRNKPWDIMLWAFYKSRGMEDPTSPWAFKPVEMISQEASVTLALGGSVQVYENPSPLRSGQLIPWRMKRIGAVGKFVKARRELCQGTQTIGQVAVLHSEAHAPQHRGANLMWGVDTGHVQGAVYSLLEHHYNVDILDEWALLQRIGEFQIVVAPECPELSRRMIDALKRFVNLGGKLLLSGARMLEAFGEEFLGVKAGGLEEKAICHIPSSNSSTPVYSSALRLVQPVTAVGIGHLGRTSLLDERLWDGPAWTLRKSGSGAVAYVPFDIFRAFAHERYVGVREFVGAIMSRLAGRLSIRVAAPRCVDVILRKKGSRKLAHFINRSSGLPNVPSNGAIDEIQSTGPITIEFDLPQRPKKVSLAFEDGKLMWMYERGTLRATLERVHIHAALVVETA
jgi:hypothetical protein